ncbi:hypothetical protein SAMN02910369_00503 [Lachnospiraceae bacterium NE2001]|nr:hypothetical protein SAMN02910369_00503 [Lachnospiraceae bacterium NE2001]
MNDLLLNDIWANFNTRIIQDILNAPEKEEDELKYKIELLKKVLIIHPAVEYDFPNFNEDYGNQLNNEIDRYIGTVWDQTIDSGHLHDFIKKVYCICGNGCEIEISSICETDWFLKNEEDDEKIKNNKWAAELASNGQIKSEDASKINKAIYRFMLDKCEKFQDQIDKEFERCLFVSLRKDNIDFPKNYKYIENHYYEKITWKNLDETSRLRKYIGEPGFGKTTRMLYDFYNCLEKIKEDKIIPIWFQLTDYVKQDNYDDYLKKNIEDQLSKYNLDKRYYGYYMCEKVHLFFDGFNELKDEDNTNIPIKKGYAEAIDKLCMEYSVKLSMTDRNDSQIVLHNSFITDKLCVCKSNGLNGIDSIVAFLEKAKGEESNKEIVERTTDKIKKMGWLNQTAIILTPDKAMVLYDLLNEGKTIKDMDELETIEDMDELDSCYLDKLLIRETRDHRESELSIEHLKSLLKIIADKLLESGDEYIKQSVVRKKWIENNEEQFYEDTKRLAVDMNILVEKTVEENDCIGFSCQGYLNKADSY